MEIRRVSLISSLLLIAAIVYACSPDIGPFFTPPARPENEARFVGGDLGLITPTLLKDYELLAYRSLSGLPPEPIGTQPQSIILNTPAPLLGVQGWTELRAKVADLAAVSYVQTYRQSKGTPQVFYLNCLDEAFNKASETLTDRQHSYSDPALFKAWVQAQDQVFSDCASQTPIYPDPPAPALPDLARADRQYQIAAAHFYAEDFDTAKMLFEQVAADAKSPWQEIGAYMVGRTFLREASLRHNQLSISQARSLFQKIAERPGSSSLRESAKGLVEHIDAVANPGQTFASLSEKLLAHNPEQSLFTHAIDESRYILLAGSFQQALHQPGIPDIFNWVEALESGNDAESIARWHASQSVPWLTLSLIESHGKDADAAALLAEADRLPRNSPAFLTAEYNCIRLRIERGEVDEPRHRLDTLLQHEETLTPSVANSLRAERMRLASNFDDLLHWASRIPVGADNLGIPEATSQVLAKDSVGFLNFQTPLAKLAQAAESKQLPSWTAADIALSAWTRAFILKDLAVMKAMAPLLTSTHPDWQASQVTPPSDPAAYAPWQFQTAVFIGRTASVQPFLAVDYREHQNKPDWWCALPDEAAQNQSEPTVAWNLPAFFVAPPNVLSGSEIATAASQLAAINTAASTQSLLGPIIMHWAQAHPQDPLVPESLYRLVRVVRYGCRTDPANGVISKAAFDLLHTRYPKSTWTAQTPYWFK